MLVSMLGWLCLGRLILGDDGFDPFAAFGVIAAVGKAAFHFAHSNGCFDEFGFVSHASTDATFLHRRSSL